MHLEHIPFVSIQKDATRFQTAAIMHIAKLKREAREEAIGKSNSNSVRGGRRQEESATGYLTTKQVRDQLKCARKIHQEEDRAKNKMIREEADKFMADRHIIRMGGKK